MKVLLCWIDEEGNKICIGIDELVPYDLYPFEINPVDRLKYVISKQEMKRLDPNPWHYRDELIKESSKRDIQLFAKMASLSERLSKSSKKVIQDEIERSINELEFPEDVAIEIIR